MDCIFSLISHDSHPKILQVPKFGRFQPFILDVYHSGESYNIFNSVRCNETNHQKERRKIAIYRQKTRLSHQQVDHIEIDMALNQSC